MTIEWMIAVATFAVVTSFTPGPNNAMLMASGLNFGFGRSLPHLLGVMIGFSGMVLAVALGIGAIFAAYPSRYTILKVLSVAYLMWLAWRIADASPTTKSTEGARPITFIEAAAFQWVNPKGWVMALGASATYLLPGNALASGLAISGIFAIAGLGSCTSWTLGGTALRRLISRPGLVRFINVGLALLLVVSLWPTMRELGQTFS